VLQNLVAARPQWALAHYELARTLSMLGAVTKRSPRCANRADSLYPGLHAVGIWRTRASQCRKRISEQYSLSPYWAAAR